MARKVLVVSAAVVALALVGSMAALRYGAALLKQQIETGLGPDSEVGSIVRDGRTVVINDVRIRAPAGWPTKDALRAEKIVVEPDLRTLLSGNVHIASITAENVYLAVLRAATARPNCFRGFPRESRLPSARPARRMPREASAPLR